MMIVGKMRIEKAARRALVLLLITAALLSVSACTGKAVMQQERSDPLIRKERIFPPDGRSRIVGMAVRDGEIMLAGNGELALYRLTVTENGGVSFDGGQTLTLKPGYEPVAVTSNDTAFYVLTKAGDGYSVLQCSGALIQNETTLCDWPFDDATGIAVNAVGSICVYGNSYITLVTPDGYAASPAEFPALVCSAAAAGGEIIVSLFDFEGESAAYYCYTPETGALAELQISLPSEYPQMLMGNMAACQGLNDEYLICSGVEFFSYDVRDGVCGRLMQWGGQGDLNTRYSNVCRVGLNTFICAERGGGLMAYSLVPRPENV